MTYQFEATKPLAYSAGINWIWFFELDGNEITGSYRLHRTEDRDAIVTRHGSDRTLCRKKNLQISNRLSRCSTGPGYWEELCDRAGVGLDEPKFLYTIYDSDTVLYEAAD